MPTMFRGDYQFHWTPNADNIQGDPRGLLRADNLTREEDGSIRLIPGSRRISLDRIQDASAIKLTVYQIYSKTMDLFAIAGISTGSYAKVRYLVSGPYVLRNWWPPFNREDVFNTAITAGVSPEGQMAGFGFGFGHVWICYGDQKKKDDGKRISDIGLANPPQGIFTAIANDAPFNWVNPNQTPFPTGEMYNYWEKIENNTVYSVAGGQHVEIDMSTANNRAIAIVGMTVNYFQDTMSFPNGGKGTDDDVFTMAVRIANTEVFTSVIVAFLLSDPTGLNLTTPDTTDYYQFEFDVMGTAFNSGINAWSTVAAARSGFKRVGTNNALNWSTVKGVRVTFNNSGYSNQSFVFKDMKWKGGTKGPLSGQFTYVQVDVDNNGRFLEKSRGSAASSIVFVENGTVRVKPTTISPNANECWVYRYGDGTNGYYLVKKIVGKYAVDNGNVPFDPAEFTDDISTENQLRLNERLNEYQANLPNDIIGIEANWKGRNWYITRAAIYPSIYENPSCYDLRWVLETGSKHVETNYFITRTSADVMVLGTSGDFYQITGTGGVQSQGDIEFFDISIQPMGIKSPPISSDFCVREGTVFYIAADGIRALSGNGSTLLTTEIDLLFKDESRWGLPPVSIKNLLQERYYINVSKNRLYFSAPQGAAGLRYLLVYNFEDKTWRYEDHGLQDYGVQPPRDAIMAMWVEDDDSIIYGTAASGDGWLRQLNYPNWNGLDFGTGSADPIRANLLTTWDADKQPRNRKDAYTLKVTVDTGSKNMYLVLRGATGFDDYNTNNTIKEFYAIVNTDRRMELIYNLYDNLETCKFFQFELQGDVNKFQFWNWSIDYEARPEQLTSLRIPNTNYGVAGRKRIYEIPMIIDTLGHVVEFRPMLDNVPQAPMNIQTFEKMQVCYQARANTTAFNIGVILRGDKPFEFYEMVQPKEIELLPDQIHYRWVPYSNFGNASRKRFIQLALTIDTQGQPVTLQPYLDGVAQIQTMNVVTTRKQTVIYTFNYFAVGVELALELKSDPGSFVGFEFYGIVFEECITEKLPPIARYVHIPTTNFGTSSRKRIRQFAFVIDTLGFTVTFNPYVDGVQQAYQFYTTTSKTTCIYTFDTFADGIDIGGTIESSQHEFLFYGVALEDCVYEKLPPIASHLVLPSTNFNTSSRKRIRQFAFVVDTKGRPVTFTPQVDGDFYSSVNLVTYRKQTYIYTFDTWLVGIDVGGSIASPTNEDFEFYGLNLEECVYEKLPPIASYMTLPFTNFNTTSRKRMRQFAFVIDTKGSPVVFTPQIDGAQTLPAHTFSTSYKQTYIYTYDAFIAGMEVGGTLHSPTNIDFEFYGLNLEECVYEKLPPIASHMVIPYTNFNTSSRKKFKQFSITIDTRGQNVNYTPMVDGQALATQIINTNRKETVVYTPEGGAIGVDLGGALQGVGNADFEFYGLNYEDAVYEKLPAKTQYLEIGPNNYGTAARKRVRTIPFIINTFGNPVTFQPTVDGVQWPANTFTTTDKTTVLYYFLSDNDSGKSNGLTSGIPFGIDYGGVLKGSSDFEFFEMLKPEVVEILPVGKKFDQFGPIEFRRVGKVREVSIRVLHTGSKLDFIIYASDNKIMSGSVTTIPNQERTYSLSLPKGINPNIFRMEISANEVFHRFDCGVRVNIDGAYTENKWVAIK